LAILPNLPFSPPRWHARRVDSGRGRSGYQHALCRSAQAV